MNDFRFAIRQLTKIGRLRTGVSEHEARTELAALGKRLAMDHPESNRNWSFTVLGFRDQVFGRTRRGIPLRAAAVAAVLLICCVNLAYALVALCIASVGIFGVVAYQVAQRTNEFGVRLALGATPRGMSRLVLWQAGRLAFIGVAIGLGLSFVTNHLLASQLFGLSPHDPVLLTLVGVVLMLVALLASYVPARRAARIHPMEALRDE